MGTPLALLVLPLALGAPAERPEVDAPERLITRHGVDLTIDERVFALFAALNALGYAEETEHKGPPLRAPVFHPIRLEVRDALRKLDDAALSGVRTMFEKSPAEVEVYLEALLAPDAVDQRPSAEAEKLGASLGALASFREKAEIAKLFDTLVVEQRDVARALKDRLERDLGAARTRLGAEARAPVTLVVVPNALEGHDVVRTVRIGTRRYLVVGPGIDAAEVAVLEAVLAEVLRPALEAAWRGAAGPRYEKAWEAVRASPRIARRYGDGRAYLAANLARVLALEVVARGGGEAPDEDALDAMSRDGLRWGRPAARALEALDGKTPLEAALARGLARVAP